MSPFPVVRPVTKSMIFETVEKVIGEDCNGGALFIDELDGAARARHSYLAVGDQGKVVQGWPGPTEPRRPAGKLCMKNPP